MGVVKLFEEREGLGIVLIGEHGGKLRRECRVIGILDERGAEQGFGVGILLAQDEQVSQAGVGSRGVRVVSQDAAVGGLGGVVLAGFFGKFSGEQVCRPTFPARA